jgi:hypothetical protein
MRKHPKVSMRQSPLITAGREVDENSKRTFLVCRHGMILSHLRRSISEIKGIDIGFVDEQGSAQHNLAATHLQLA